MHSDSAHGLIAGWLIRLTPPCREVVRLVSEDMDRPLPPGVKLRLHLHLRLCAWCERYRQQLLVIRRAMRQQPDRLMEQGRPPGLSNEARRRLKEVLRQPQDRQILSRPPGELL